MVAWSYSGIYKNTQENSQPRVLVGFRELVADKLLSDEVVFRTIPLTAVGQVRVGSIWEAGSSNSALSYEVRDFDVNFSAGHWRFVSFGSAWDAREPDIYPSDIHRLKYQRDRNWYIEFKLPNGGKLFVPCIEFFSRCYGRSNEVNRILATYDWDEAQRRLYAPIDEPEEAGKWKVKLRMRLRNGDTTFLAHAKYDPYTTSAAKSIYSQIESQYSPESKNPLFIQAGPWFQGPAELRCCGVTFNNGRSFLALQINGCSDPQGTLIERDRENTEKVLEGDPPPEGVGKAWAGSQTTRLVRPPAVIDLTDKNAPDHRSSSVEVLDATFLTLGIPRTVVDKYGKPVSSASKDRPLGKDGTEYSSGERQGDGKGVGYASLHAPVQIESQGALLDIWNAAHALKAKYPDVITSVDWFTFSDQYKPAGNPKLIALEPIEEDPDIEIPSDTKRWCFLNFSANRMRGIMVLRLIANSRPIYLIEIERRVRKTEGDDGTFKEAEEAYRGFVTLIGTDAAFQEWLNVFLYQVRYVRGIVSKLVPDSPGKADTFKHSKSKGDHTLGEPAVLNALEKMGIAIADKNSGKKKNTSEN